jgi:1-phosphatidylinositol-3-phosphate 5-kinase
MSDLAKTALSPRPVVSESEQEYPNPIQRKHLRRGRNPVMSRKASTSDFESSYAANIAPRYLMHNRRSGPTGTRIPTPSGQVPDSHESSRKTSPEKRPGQHRNKEVRFNRASSPQTLPGRSFLAPPKQPKVRISSRTKEKTAIRPPLSTKPSFRRAPGPASKVMAIAKNFERLSREAERTKGRYNIIRGKRARPVASARATVEVLDSVKDALRDDPDTDASSEADDEGEDMEEGSSFVPPAPQQPLLATAPSPTPVPLETTVPNEAQEPTLPLSVFPDSPVDNGSQPLRRTTMDSTEHPSLPPSPKPDVGTPPASDLELLPQTGTSHSILKALSEFWQPSRQLDDPMSDPEHIFRDSSMIVRTDEPTSIIALALK